MRIDRVKGFSLIETIIVISVILIISSIGMGYLSAQRISKKALDNQFAILLSDIRFMQDSAKAKGTTQTLRLLWETQGEYRLIGDDAHMIKVRKLPTGMTIRGDGLRGRMLEFYPSGVVGPQAGGLIMQNGSVECRVHFNIGTGALKIERAE